MLRKNLILFLFFSFLFISVFSQENFVNKNFFSNSKPFNYFFLNCRIPASWEVSESEKLHFPCSVFFKVENKSVRLLSFMGENTYFEYPTAIILLPETSLSRDKIERFLKKVFIKVLLTESELKDYKLSWQNVNYKESNLNWGGKLEYYWIAGEGNHPTLKKIVIIQNLIQVSSKIGSAIFVTGLSVSGEKGLNRTDVANIQEGFKKQVVNLLNSALTSKLVLPQRAFSMEKYLIKKGKFRHQSFYSSNISSLKFKSSTSAGKKLFFDFYGDGTCRVLDNFFSSGFVNMLSPSSYENLLSGISGSGYGKWSRRVKFKVYKGEGSNFWLILYFKDLPRIYSLVKNKGEYFYVTVKSGSGYKNIRKKIIGMEIGGKLEGYFSRYGAITLYSPPK